jgi:glycerol-3-phosphate acyltransferase PlsY
MVQIFISILIGYLLGSIPTAYIAVKIIRGKDIRDIDVGNVGTAAAMRQTGKIPGLIVAFVDIAKGSASILIASVLGISEIWILCAGFAAFLGHCFPVYIGFRGGQGVATVIGIFLVLLPYITLIIIGIIAVVLLIIRRVFPTICVVGISLPLLIFFINGSLPLLIFSLVIIVFMTARNYKGIIKEIYIFKSYLNRKLKR